MVKGAQFDPFMIAGPAMSEEETTTIFLMSDMVATTDLHGNYTVVF